MGLFAKLGAVKKEMEQHLGVSAEPKSEPTVSAQEPGPVADATPVMTAQEPKPVADVAETIVSVPEPEAMVNATSPDPVENREESVENVPEPAVEEIAEPDKSAPEPVVEEIAEPVENAPEPEPVASTAEPDKSAPEPEPVANVAEPKPTPAAPSVSPATTPTSAPKAEPIVVKPTSLKSNDSENSEADIQCVPMGAINDENFSDVWITPEKKTYIWGGKTNAGLIEVSFTDFGEFLKSIEDAYEGTRSYLLQYKGRNYRVERTISTGGPQFCARKMPTKVPNLRDLGLPQGVYNHLLSLAGGSGLILLAGATGSGKSTTIAALLKEYLIQKGGYAFTIEDPVELPLDGVYVTPNHELGLCKQTTPPDGIWAEGIKSALRSKPRYIYLGEIRSPDIASEALRAATSGHLVLSSIHANNVSEAVNSLVKYAASSGISEAMAYELVAGGFLGVVHQILSGAPKRAHLTTLFANPDVNAGCQVRGMIRNGKLNMATLIEQQSVLLKANKPLFK